MVASVAVCREVWSAWVAHDRNHRLRSRLLFVTGAVALAVVSTTLTGRIPVPAPAIFLVAAALVSDIWPQVYEHVPILTVERVAVVALIVILFNGGMDIGWRRFRASAGPILSLGVVGTFATAGLLAVFAHYALGFTGRWPASSALHWHQPIPR